MKKGKLYLIPTPIASETTQLIGLEVRNTIKSLKHFLVEDIRTARRFISSLKLGVTIEELRFEQLDKHSKLSDLSKLMAPLQDGYDVGIMSEAGCPGVADPGAMAVNYAHSKGITVVPHVGPSSIILALMASGFNGQSFAFHGYLPIEKAARKKKIRTLESEMLKQDQTQIFMDTPYRNNQLLADLLLELRPGTLLSIASDITGKDEFIQTKSVGQWKKNKPDLHKIPTIFSIYRQ